MPTVNEYYDMANQFLQNWFDPSVGNIDKWMHMANATPKSFCTNLDMLRGDLQKKLSRQIFALKI